MYGKFTHIWLIFMVTVGKYTVRPMDPMAHVSLVRFGYTYSTFLCVAFFFVETATLWQKQINSRSVIILILYQTNPKWGPCFDENFALVLGGGVTLTDLHLQTFSGHWGSRYIILDSPLMYLLGKCSSRFHRHQLPQRQQNIHTPHMLSVVRSSTSTWRRRNSAKTGLGTNCDHVTMWHPCWDSPGKKKHSIPWDGLTLIDLHMDLMISEWVQIFHSRNFVHEKIDWTTYIEIESWFLNHSWQSFNCPSKKIIGPSIAHQLYLQQGGPKNFSYKKSVK